MDNIAFYMLTPTPNQKLTDECTFIANHALSTYIYNLNLLTPLSLFNSRFLFFTSKGSLTAVSINLLILPIGLSR